MEDFVKQLLLEEIRKLHIEYKENQKSIQNILSLSTKYPFLSDLCNKYSVNVNDWEALVREALFFTNNDVRYMYERTMQIIHRFKDATDKYFQVKNTVGTYLLPDRLSTFNRLLLLYTEFFGKVYPRIINQLNITSLNIEKQSPFLRGKIDWNKTIHKNLYLADPTVLLTFLTHHTESSLETPENILLLSCCVRLNLDSKNLLLFTFEDSLNLEELTILNKIFLGSHSILRNSTLRPLVQKAQEYGALSIYDRQLLNLESHVLNRLNNGTIKQKQYFELLEWISKYRKLNIRIISPNYTSFPLEKTKSLDTMFELWVLFEILDYLIKYENAIVTKSSGTRFNVQVQSLDFDLCYQPSRYSGWALQGEPDYAIEIDKKCLIVMDAKNWSERKDEAIYKMLGYLNNFDITLGILVYPNDSLFNHKKIMVAKNLSNHSNQTIFNCILPLSGADKVKRKKESIKTMFDLIVSNLS